MNTEPEQHNDDNTRTHLALTAGTAVSHYEIISKIGAGGMGEVYLADDTELDRKVALKFLPAHMCQNEECRTRFKREAQAAAKLKHPNIVTIYEVSEYQGRPFFAMEHIEGDSLRELIKEDLRINRIIDISIQILGGLDKAHKSGVTHRDIKPSNIVIDADGRPKLLDFGLAAVQGIEGITKTGSTLGTVGYMSPEHIQVHDVDQRSDLFSFGVVLYGMITGQLPFAGDNEAAIMNSVLNDTPEPLSRYKSGVPDDLQRIVSKLLEKDPQLRYQSAAGVVSDLRRIQRDSESGITPRLAEKPPSRAGKILVPALIIVIAALLMILKPWKIEVDTQHEAVAAENRLAIMYFDNLADAADSLRLGEIISSLLTADLGNSDYIQVVSRQRLHDILKLLGHEEDQSIDLSISSEIARRAGASQILSGSIIQTEPTVLVTYQVADAADGHVVTSGRVSGEAGQTIFDVTDQLTIAVKSQFQLPDEALSENDPPVSQITSNSTDAYRFYLEGLRQYNELKYDSAAGSLKRAISIDSNFVMAYYYLSIVDGSRPFKVMTIESAHDRLDRVSKREKLLVQARYAGYVERDRDASRKLLETLLEKTPDDKWATFWLGILYQEQYRDPERSKKYYHETIKLDSNYKMAYNQLAYIYSKLELTDSALWAINEYIEIAPEEPNPYDTRADLYRFSGDLSKAAASYEKALQIDPSFRSKYKLADTYLFMGKLDKADSLNLELATSGSKSERAQNRLRLTVTLQYRGKIREALLKIDQLIETDKIEMNNDAWIISKILKKAYLYDILGRADSAIRFIEDEYDGAIDSMGYDMQAWLAYYYYRAGKADEAEQIRMRLTSVRDSMIGLRQAVAGETALLGFVAYSAGDYEEAISLLEEAQQVISSFDDYRWFPLEYFKAMTLYEMGNLGEAVEQFRAALRCYDSDRAYHIARAVLTHYWLGRTYEESGWHQQAIEQYETFLDIWKDADPGIDEVEDARVRLSRLRADV